MTRVVGYIRYSPRPSDKDEEKEITLDVQRGKIKAYAELYELELVAVIPDHKVSAKDLNRPGLIKVLAMLDAGEVDGLLIAKLDRLSRSIKDMATLIDNYFKDRFQLFSVNEQVNTKTPGGRLVLNVLMSVAQWEREETSQRTKDALQELKKQGVKLGRVPLGYRRGTTRGKDGRLGLEPLDEELVTVARALELRGGGKSYRQIAEIMQSEKRLTKRGGRWHAATVRQIVKRMEEIENSDG